MVQRQALPSILCLDCGHPASRHREERECPDNVFTHDKASCSGTRTVGSTCSCQRTRQAVEHAGDMALKARAEERRRLGYALLAGLVLAIAVGVGSVLASRSYARSAVSESERKLCSIVILNDDTYHETPPTTPAGKAIAENFTQLRAALGCPPYKERS